MKRAVHGTPVYSTADVRAIEAAAATAGAPSLMERAGLAAAELAREISGGTGKPVLVLAGPGNNGGDALVLARLLKQQWFSVTVVHDGDEKKLSADALAALRAWREAGGATVREPPAGSNWGLAVDGLFGIGLEREISGRHANWIAVVNAHGAPVLALDLPSGLHSDTGRVMGCAIRASHTVTFIALKPGLLTLDGPEYCGTLHLRTLDVDAEALRPARGRLIGREILASTLAPRRPNTHKGDYGSVGVLGGARGMVGAALLTARAALKAGAGRVYAGLLAPDAPAVDLAQPELMLRDPGGLLALGHLSCLAVGPGLGQSPEAAYWLRAALESAIPLVADADALNLLAADARLAALARERQAPTLLTPHPAEAARLLATTTARVQDDRIAAAVALADRLGCPVALKGAGTICAAPGGAWHVNTTGNPGLASGGMGDVLTGLIAALIAQGGEPTDALLAGVYAHGAAADAAVAGGIGPAGLTSSEVIESVRALINATGVS